jgi:glycosyltransferase involved in cell wall biosynthesis
MIRPASLAETGKHREAGTGKPPPSVAVVPGSGYLQAIAALRPPAQQEAAMRKLAFVIPAYNEEALIGKCLESVVAEIARSGADAEIIVVNNASTDRTGEIARSFPTVRVVDEPKKGLVNARDAGFAASEGFELIANIDSDTMVPPGWLDTVLHEFGRDPRLVCLSGPYVYYDMSAWSRFLVSMFYGLTWLIYVINRYVLRVGSVVQGG